MSGPITALTLPQWGLTMTEGKVGAWLKPAGATLAPGEELVEIETSKITSAVEAPLAGVLRRVVAATGATLPVGALLGVIAAAEVEEGEIAAFIGGFSAPAPAAASETSVKAQAATMLFEGAFGRLRYLEAGSGPLTPMVLLHGLGADLGAWMFIQPALAEGRRTVALELPGHGGSDKDVGSGDPERFVATVEDALERLGLARAHLVGHSMGGAIAAALALRRPDLVSRLSLIAPAGFGPAINREFIEGFVGATRRKEAAAALAMLVSDPSLIGRSMIEDVLRYKRLDGVAEALARIVAVWFPDGLQTFLPGRDIAAAAVPLQVIWGRQDRILPVAQANVVAPAARHILEGAGHLPHMEKAGETARLIAQFANG